VFIGVLFSALWSLGRLERFTPTIPASTSHSSAFCYGTRTMSQTAQKCNWCGAKHPRYTEHDSDGLVTNLILRHKVPLEYMGECIYGLPLNCLKSGAFSMLFSLYIFPWFRRSFPLPCPTSLRGLHGQKYYFPLLSLSSFLTGPRRRRSHCAPRLHCCVRAKPLCFAFLPLSSSSPPLLSLFTLTKQESRRWQATEAPPPPPPRS
jgi:hypothetical protein